MSAATENIVAMPIEGDIFSMAGMQRAFRAIVEAHGDVPRELRLHAANYTDFGNLLVSSYRWAEGQTADDWDGFTFNGVPVKPQPRAPLMTLLAVYPLPGIGD